MREEHATHSMLMGYVLWIFGFIGAHRFYFGKQITGVIWFLTFGLFFIGWIIDLLLIPSMARQADTRFEPGRAQLQCGLGITDLSRATGSAPFLYG